MKGEILMNADSPLKDKLILIVDDESDVLDILEEMLDTCKIHRATDYDTALKHLDNNTYDAVILDIMGVNGFELLKKAVSMGFPAIMLTAHALTPEALKKSIKLGAVSFLPKEKMSEIRLFLEDIVADGGKPSWQKTFNRAGAIFNRRFGPAWREKDMFFKEFIEELNKETTSK